MAVEEDETVKVEMVCWIIDNSNGVARFRIAYKCSCGVSLPKRLMYEHLVCVHKILPKIAQSILNLQSTTIPQCPTDSKIN